MAKKIKHGAQRPPLSGIDKFLYVILILLGFGLFLFSVIYMGFNLPDRLHNDGSDILWKDQFISYLAALPLSIIWFILSIIFIAGKRRRIPIFGNPNYKPKTFSPTIKVYPLFSPQYSENFTNKERRNLRILTIFMTIWIPLSLVLYPMGIYPREVYLENDTMVSYNMLNNESHRGYITDAESLKIHTYSPRRSHKIYVALTVTFEEENYTFDLSRSIDDIEKALYIKNLFHENQIEISSPKRTIKKLISQYSSHDPDTIPLLYELYEYTP